MASEQGKMTENLYNVLEIEEPNMQKKRKQNKEEIDCIMQEATIQEINPNTSEATSMIIEEQNSRYSQIPKIIEMTSELQTKVNNIQIQADLILPDQSTDISRGSYTQIKQNRGQTANTVGIVQVQGAIPEQAAETTELSNITQIDEIESEDQALPDARILKREGKKKRN
ncbi:32341_t:CDS:2 [Gigaspora margarita]|uniref:32341_t:CDS:1 n=1 Tax=Gigaspora margarita TaxID=4874 RepID=A0ABN7WV45_GIGMA|nr:32341_t:CDS:2 [Gigaspora margarita]